MTLPSKNSRQSARYAVPIRLDTCTYQCVSMQSHSTRSIRYSLTLLAAGIGFLLVLGGVAGTMNSTGQHPSAPIPDLTPSTGALQIASFSFSPSPVAAGTQTQGIVTLSGGTAPFQLWFNNTAPGCGPSNNPVMLSSPSLQFNCTPSSPGTYNVHMDALDSSAPPNKASQTTTLIVNNNNGNGNNGSNGGGNNGGGSNNSFQLPSTLLTMLMLFGIVFLGAIVALAAGVIATAVLVTRRLRQLTETMAKANHASFPEKPSK